MLFTSNIFYVFFAFFLISLRLFPRNRLFVLNVFNLAFYGAWNPLYLVPLLLCVGLDYFCSQQIAAQQNLSKKRFFLAISLFSNFGLLGVFKYMGLGIQIVNDLTSSQIQLLQLTLPVGISFYVFQSVSYVFDVYRCTIPPAKNFRDFLAYVTFFPQLIAGPIERADGILKQLEKFQQRDRVHYNFIEGGPLFFQGLLKKLVVADTLSLYVDQVFGDLASYSSLSTILATCFFSLQIYADFSAYTDMARGLGRILGIELMENFRFPYWSKSIQEFWSRWHISLSTWLRDYLYVSLGGNRRGKIFTLRNLMITMILGGIWHGANYTFVLWGVYHGILLCLHRLWKNSSFHFSFPSIMAWGMTLWSVTAGWFLFRVQTIADIKLVLTKIFHPHGTHFLPEYKVLVIAVVFIAMDWVLAQDSNRITHMFKRPAPVRYAVALVLLTIFYIGRAGSDQAFIYFQF